MEKRKRTGCKARRRGTHVGTGSFRLDGYGLCHLALLVFLEVGSDLLDGLDAGIAAAPRNL